MKLISEIVKSSLLGLDKFYPQDTSELLPVSQKIIEQTADKEDAFLKLCTTAFIYREAGNTGVEVKENFTPCLREIKKTTSNYISAQIKSAIQSKDDIILRYLINACNKHSAVAERYIVPLILDKALTLKDMSADLLLFAGETGKWLCSINPAWYIHFSGDAEIWETGSLESRKAFFSAARSQDPQSATDLLKQTIQDETAAVREDFINLLIQGLSIHDEVFLTSMLSDKSQKVKQEAYLLLKKIKGSQLNTLYLNYALKCISIQEERYMLVSKKKYIEFSESIYPDEAIFNSGVERISSEKGIKDNIFWLGQVLAFVDTASLAASLDYPELNLLNLLLEHKESKILLPYLVHSAILFKNGAWAKRFLELPELSEIGLLSVLPREERSAYYEKFIQYNLAQLLTLNHVENNPILETRSANRIIEQLKHEPYRITQNQYKLLGLQLPMDILPLLKKHIEITDEDPRTKYFGVQVIEMMRMIELRNNLKF